jgi:hypothetical protein
MNFTRQQREEYNIHRANACEGLKITGSKYNWFRRYGQTLHKIYENQCNGYQNDYGKEDQKEAAADEREEQVINDALQAEAQNLGLFLFLQTDPRGATVYLNTEAMTPSNYNQGYCIY